MVVQLGVTGPQRLVIRMVGRFPGIAARELAGILHIHPSTLTGILKRLEALDLISRRPHPRDRRRAFLGLTPKGREVDLNSEGTVESAVKQAIAELAPVKIQNAQEVLSKLADALELAPALRRVELGPSAVG
jgi:DNA-binding MarR family transcriptional regulator